MHISRQTVNDHVSGIEWSMKIIFDSFLVECLGLRVERCAFLAWAEALDVQSFPGGHDGCNPRTFLSLSRPLLAHYFTRLALNEVTFAQTTSCLVCCTCKNTTFGDTGKDWLGRFHGFLHWLCCLHCLGLHCL